MPRGRELKIDPTLERFSKEMERVRREEEKAWTDQGLKPNQFTQTWLLERLMSQFETLAEVVNESKSRSEVVRHAASVANTARKIAAIEFDDAEGKSDVRWLPSEF